MARQKRPSSADSHDQHVTVSSNTLFHFTSTYENLLGILRDEFQPRYCLEDFGGVARPEIQDDGWEFAFPMVCFCDLPLSQTATHLSVYGNYGVGMVKHWGIRNGVAPVLYVHQNSEIWRTLWRLTVDTLDDPSTQPDITADIFHLLGFMKPYEGRFWRNGGYIQNVRFYDEREWRYVPQRKQQIDIMLDKEEFLDTAKRTHANSLFAKNFRLRFRPRDIRYIVVASEDEVLRMVNDVLNLKGRKYVYDEVQMLTTRIISARQIREDF